MQTDVDGFYSNPIAHVQLSCVHIAKEHSCQREMTLLIFVERSTSLLFEQGCPDSSIFFYTIQDGMDGLEPEFHEKTP